MNDWTPPAEVFQAGRSTIGTLFSAQAAAYPDLIAVVAGEEQLTYAELDERSNRLGQLFLNRGLVRGDRVGILARNCLEYLEVELAAAKAGIILATLNWRLAERELTHCISLVEPKLIILQPDLKDGVEALDIAVPQYLEFGEDYETAVAAQPEEQPMVEVDPEDGLVILYTSGTTGLPKGALVSHRAMIARGMCFTSEQQIPQFDHFMAWTPFYHMASTDQSLAVLLRAGTIHVVDGYLPDQMIEIIGRTRMQFMFLTPGMVGLFAEAVKASGVKPAGVAICGAMADLVPKEEIAAATSALGAVYANTFGATETGLAPATANTIPKGVAPTVLSKRQSSFCEVRLVDPDDNDVPVGQPGEVALRGPTLFSGYWKADETNAKDFRNGWFHMGDVMRRNPDGTLDYVDRVKYMIKSGGENIYPAEIEQVITRDARVTEAVVVRRSDPRWGEVPVAFVVTNQAMAEDEVVTLCRNDLSSYKLPKAVFFIQDTDLPRSTTGKIQRHLLEARLVD